MDFAIYYSTSADKTAPAITDPGRAATSHDLTVSTCSFSVQASDDSGVYRVLAVYDDGLGLWKNLDLTYNSGTSRWEGLPPARPLYQTTWSTPSTPRGKCRIPSWTRVPTSTRTGSPTARTTRARASSPRRSPQATPDGDGMPRCLRGPLTASNKARPPTPPLDPDYDGFTNLEEYGRTSDPQNPDTDGDGDNDGSEAHNGRNPLVAGDGRAITLLVTKAGKRSPTLLALRLRGRTPLSTAPIGLPFYRPLFDYQKLRPTAPMPLTERRHRVDRHGSSGGWPARHLLTTPSPMSPRRRQWWDVLSPSAGPAAGGNHRQHLRRLLLRPCTVSFGGNPGHQCSRRGRQPHHLHRPGTCRRAP